MKLKSWDEVYSNKSCPNFIQRNFILIKFISYGRMEMAILLYMNFCAGFFVNKAASRKRNQTTMLVSSLKP